MYISLSDTFQNMGEDITKIVRSICVDTDMDRLILLLGLTCSKISWPQTDILKNIWLKVVVLDGLDISYSNIFQILITAITDE